MSEGLSISGPPQGVEAALHLSHPGFSLDVDLSLPGAGVTVLFGPSGCGKTTVLRAIAGLERPNGRVMVNGAVWQDDERGLWVPTHERRLGYVFQEAALFPHLTVRGNLDYGRLRVPAAQRKVGLDEAVELLGIGHLLHRRPMRLSGGERQRVAIARALLTSPNLLLMDEPLSALDGGRKAEILPYLERLQQQLALPVLYVTHAIDEMTRLAQYLVLMEHGRVVAAGPMTELLARLDLPLSRAEEASTVLDAVVAEHDEDYAQSRLAVAGLPLWVGLTPRGVGHRLRVRVLARDVSVALEAPRHSSILNVLPAHVEALRHDGLDTVTLQLRLDGPEAFRPLLLARITRRSRDQLGICAGQAVFAQIKGAALMGAPA